MDKLKKYFRYLLLFILMYIIVSLLTAFGMRDIKEHFICNINGNQKFNIEVEDAKSSKLGGQINVKVTNKTEEIQTDKYLKIELYNNDEFVGVKYKEIKYLNIGETNRFEIIFDEKNVNIGIVSVVDEIEEPNKEEIEKELSGKYIEYEYTQDQDAARVVTPIIAMLGVMVII